MAERARSGDGVSLRGGISLWYSQECIFRPDDMADLAWVGGTPDDERDPEEGVEALPRSVVRTTAGYWTTERLEETLPDLEELWARDQDKPLRRQREQEAVGLVRRSIFSGDPVTPRCPECEGQCVYNGNYFCIQCEWALPEYELLPSPSREWLHKWFEEAYASLMDYRAQR